MKWYALPTWLIVQAILPGLHITHPWHGRRFTLEDWSNQRTDLTKVFDTGLWVSAAAIVLLLHR